MTLPTTKQVHCHKILAIQYKQEANQLESTKSHKKTIHISLSSSKERTKQIRVYQ
jgi:hypothetical protein